MSTTEPTTASSSRVRRFACIAVGYTLVASGTVMLVLPGPGAALMLGGLAVLGREQPWARRLELRIRTGAARLVRRVRPAQSGT